MTLPQWLYQRLVSCFRGRKRLVLKISADAVAVSLSFFLAYLIRFDGALPASQRRIFISVLPFLLLVTLSSYYGFRLYKGLYQYSSAKDLLTLVTAHSVGLVAFRALLPLLHLPWTPHSVLLIFWALGLVLSGGVRFSYRLLREIAALPHKDRRPVLVVGAGCAGEMILRQLRIDAALNYYPVGIVDDDPDKRSTTIHGVPVLGTTKDIPEIASALGVEQIIIAVPSASARQMRTIVGYCEQAGVDFKTVPGPRELINGQVTLNQLRGVKIEDLLEREPVRTDAERIGDFLKNKVILVTGAGGSIGQELCRQIMEYKPEKLIMLDRAENSLFYLENDMKGRWIGGFTAVVGDVCDAAKLDQVMAEYRPEIVFHAAAHKHVPLMELNPEEAIKNNLKGTRTVAEVAKRHRVKRFVLISTDKAVEPTSIMGASKRLAELYVQGANRDGRTKFITVRFGNVLGSNGSVVTLFQKQIERGGPVTVTDPEMTRYFMTIPEAVTLILQASTIGEGGEIFVLDMGEPIKVVDMARHLISLSGLEPDRDIAIEFTGKRPGEKLFEQLWQKGERPRRTEYEKILVARSNGLDYAFVMQQLDAIQKAAEAMQRKEM
ncbi:MAG: polysaccharide biosynthesis protein, partial [Calditrichaeota bacterium]